MQVNLRIPREVFLKKYTHHTLEEIESLFPSSDLKGLIQDYSELFSLESHEPESFKKNLVSEADFAIMPIIFHASHPPHITSPQFHPKFYDEKKTLYSPFETTGLTKNRLDEKIWFYLNENVQIKGPFSTVDMDRFFNHGELHGSTKVAYDQKEKFCKIYKFVEIFREFEKKTEEFKKTVESNGEQEHKFKKFGFVNQHKSAGNSPLLKNGSKVDAIDEHNEENDKGIKKPQEQKKNGQKSGAAPKKHSINIYQEAEHTYHPKKKAYGKGKNDYVTEYVPKSNK